MDIPRINAKPVSEPTEAEELEEGQIDESRIDMPMPASLASCPTPALLLSEDRSGMLEERHPTDPQTVEKTLHDELELATYEYAALEDRHCKLWNEHRKLLEQCSFWSDVVQGLLLYKQQPVSTEAGWEGLRAKAKAADVLRPIIREAGGLQALVSQAQAVRSLIEQVGSLQELEDLVSKSHMLQTKVAEVGGLEGLIYLSSEVNLLRSKQQEHVELRRSMDDQNGPWVKAAKYEKLEQAFAEIRTAPVDTAYEQQNLPYTNVTRMQGTDKALDSVTEVRPRHARGNTSSIATAMINPARASRISATPIEDDPDRDLYEAPPPVSKPQKKTGSNNLPLGPCHVATHVVRNAYRQATLKREQEDLPTNTTKRPRLDIGRTSALLHASLASTSTRDSKHNAMQLNRSGIKVEDAEDILPIVSPDWPSHFDRSRSTAAPASAGQPAHVSIEPRSGSHGEVSEDATSRGSFHRLPQPKLMVKTEQAEESHERYGSLTLSIINDINRQQAAVVLLRRCPIAVWSGEPNGTLTHVDLKMADKLPLNLASFLWSELTKYISDTNIQIWNSMPANRDTCILRYLVDGHRPSSQPQELRACRICSSAWARHSRPCAMLHDVDGVTTVVFLPLREQLRHRIGWKEKGYYVMGAQ